MCVLEKKRRVDGDCIWNRVGLRDKVEISAFPIGFFFFFAWWKIPSSNLGDGRQHHPREPAPPTPTPVVDQAPPINSFTHIGCRCRLFGNKRRGGGGETWRTWQKEMTPYVATRKDDASSSMWHARQWFPTFPLSPIRQLRESLSLSLLISPSPTLSISLLVSEVGPTREWSPTNTFFFWSARVRLIPPEKEALLHCYVLHTCQRIKLRAPALRCILCSHLIVFSVV